jgi:hypothetical protein
MAVSLCLVAGGALIGTGEVGACGDKLLVLGRHVSSQRAHGAVRRGSILVFLDDHGDLRMALHESRLQRDLELAGHSLRMVSRRADLVAEIRTGAYDVVIAGIADAAALRSEVQAAPGGPILIPLVVNTTGDEWAEAAAEFSCIRESPSLGKHYLVVIEEAIVQRRAREGTKKRR